jgi:hypothetical protein
MVQGSSFGSVFGLRVGGVERKDEEDDKSNNSEKYTENFWKLAKIAKFCPKSANFIGGQGNNRESLDFPRKRLSEKHLSC